MLDTHARVFDGALRVREATWRDGEALTDLHANAPETVRDWRLQHAAGPGSSWLGLVTYWYERIDNASQGWLDEVRTMVLDDPSWGPKPGFWARVVGWDDHWVIDDGGEVVACGTLWDRGRDDSLAIEAAVTRPDTDLAYW